MHWIDWTIVAACLAGVIGITAYAQRYSRTVADFLAANRMAGRYLLTVSSGFMGTISLVALWEMVYSTGLTTQWWQQMGAPVGLFLSLTGFIVYRFRQTRALTLAQFLEARYSRRFRYYAGFLCWIAGVLNYGIFPAVTARVLIVFLGLPESFQVFGFACPMFPAVMAVYLLIAVFIACSGGQVTIMITDFLQGAFLMLIFVVILFFLASRYAWSDIMAGLEIGVPAGQSMINPFKTSTTDDFNIWYFLICIFGLIYNAKSWQGNSGYNAAARTPHESVIAGVLASWRGLATSLCVVLMPLVAYAVLHLPQYAAETAPLQEQIAAIADPQLRVQMTVPLFMRSILPIGLGGLFAAVLICSAVSCDDTYLHAWGTILIQDVIGPLRNRPFSRGIHMLILRLSIVGVALFAFLFSLLFPFKGYILMFFALTGAIYLGGAGAVIIGGLYWKRGTTAAAWCALSTGTVLGFGGMVVQQFWPKIMGDPAAEFPINGQWIYFLAMLSSSLIYVVVSLCGRENEFNLDRLLHRGEYAVQEDMVISQDAEAAIPKRRFSLAKLVGITPEFSRFERFLFYGSFGWSMGWWLIFLLGTIACLLFAVPDSAWYWYWKINICFSVLLGCICAFWILGGGVRDMLRLFRDLASKKHSDDDGFVN